MAAKKPNLVQAFQAQEEKQKPKIEVVEAAAVPVSETKRAASSRENKKHIGAYFDEAIYRQLKIIGAETGMTTQDMLADALNFFFEKHDKPPIA